jgi:hypothetical protein
MQLFHQQEGTEETITSRNDESLDVVEEEQEQGHDTSVLLEQQTSSSSASMSEQFDHLDQLFTNQELEIAKMDVMNLNMELKKKNDTIREMQKRLDVEKNIVSKLELERDLADAESKLVRNQIKDILQCYSSMSSSSKDEPTTNNNDPLQYVVAHQFVPSFPTHQTQYSNYECWKKDDDELTMDHHLDLEAKLLKGWQHQEKLVYSISKHFEKAQGTVSIDQQNLYKERRHGWLKFFPLPYKKDGAGGVSMPSFIICPTRGVRRLFVFHKVSKKKKRKKKKKETNKQQKKKLFRLLLNQPEYEHVYQSMTDDNDARTIQHRVKKADGKDDQDDDDDDDDERTAFSNDDTTATVTNQHDQQDFTNLCPRLIMESSTSRLRKSPSCLIQEFLSCHESNRKYVKDIRTLLHLQATRIHDLENELCRFLYHCFPTTSPSSSCCSSNTSTTSIASNSR